MIPKRLFQEFIENKHWKIFDPKPLREIARDKVKLDDKQLKKELARKAINPYYFADGALQRVLI